jgi:molecular chaperone DnaK
VITVPAYFGAREREATAEIIDRVLRAVRLDGRRGIDDVIMVGGSSRIPALSPRAVGILIEDSFDPSGQRSSVEHLVAANTPLPAEVTATRFGTIVANQQSVCVQVYEQAGPVPSAQTEHNRLVPDRELTGLGALSAGSVITITIRIAADGRLAVIAHEPHSGSELALKA